jgi:hypothetical protein
MRNDTLYYRSMHGANRNEYYAHRSNPIDQRLRGAEYSQVWIDGVEWDVRIPLHDDHVDAIGNGSYMANPAPQPEPSRWARFKEVHAWPLFCVSVVVGEIALFIDGVIRGWLI